MQLFLPIQALDPDGALAPAADWCGEIVTADGVRLRAAVWHPERETCGTVALFNGRIEFIEKYCEVIAELLGRGFTVATLDWRGQGGSARLLADRRRGHVEDFNDYVEDLAAFMDQVVQPHCPAPYFGLAHSMGAAILLLSAGTGGYAFERMVLSAPLIRLFAGRGTHRWSAVAVRLAVMGGFSQTRVPRTVPKSDDAPHFTNNRFTGDRCRFARTQAILNEAPDLRAGRPTFGWINAAYRAMDVFARHDFPGSVTVPTLMLVCGNDRVVSNRAIEELAMAMPAGGHLLVPGARHELMMERDAMRDMFWGAFDAFIPGSGAKE